MLTKYEVVTPTASVPCALEAPRVLVVEDERRTREILQFQLRDLGYEVFGAATAYEAIRVVAEKRPDVLVVDGLLPQMHGFELARYIRAMDRDYHPRIVLITAIYKQTRYQNEAKLKYGIDAYLIKPFSKQQLEEVVSCTAVC